MKRFVTGVICVAVVLGSLALPSNYFAVVAGGLMLLLGYEWMHLCKASRLSKRVFIVVLLLVIGAFLLWSRIAEILYYPIVVISSVMWLAIVSLLITRPVVIGRSLWGKFGPEIGTLVILSFWITLVHLHNYHFWLLLTVLASVTMFDTFSFIWGVNFGKYKLSPRLSPGKSWEGVAGGALSALTPITVLALANAKGWVDSQDWYIPAAALSVVIAPFGDLFESLLKRLQGVKDSGSLLPGHGGLLDRMDSHLAVVPCCAFFALMFS